MASYPTSSEAQDLRDVVDVLEKGGDGVLARADGRAEGVEDGGEVVDGEVFVGQETGPCDIGWDSRV